MKPLELPPIEIRRHQDIVAFKNQSPLKINSAITDSTITAFHAYNLEVAEISEESFAMMTPIDLLTGEIPELLNPQNSEQQEAFAALQEWTESINPVVKSGHLDFGIRSITLNINQICNLKCVYCAAGGDGTYGEPTTQISLEKTFPQLKFFLHQLKPGQKFSISFVGGEPLIHPEAILAIYNYLHEVASLKQIIPVMQIVTNGTLLQGKTLDIIRSMKIQVIFSLDGEKKYNDVARPSKNGQSSTDLTVAAVKSLVENRGLVTAIGLSAICSPQSPHMLETYDFFLSLQPDFMEFSFENAEPSHDLQKRFIDEHNLIAAKAFALGGEKELRKIRKFDYYFGLLDRQQRIENHCGAGKSYLMVDAKNKLYPCVWEAGQKNEVVGQNEQLNHQELAKYSKSLIELNNCQTCWARHLCGGGCMSINKSHTGHKHRKDKMFCERIRSLILTTLMYYKLSRSLNPTI